MNKVKIIRLKTEEEDAIKQEYKKNPSKEFSLQTILEKNQNKTLSIIRQLKNIVLFEDIEDMVNLVEIINKIKDCKESYIELKDEELKLVIKIFKEALKTKKIGGQGLEMIVEVYKTFKEVIVNE